MTHSYKSPRPERPKRPPKIRRYPDRDYAPHYSDIRFMPASAVAMAAYILPALLSFGRFGGFSLMILAWIIPLLIYIRENSSGLVQFHAMQAFLLYLLSGLLHLAAFILNRHLLMGAIAAFDIARAPLGVTLTFLLLQLPGYVLPLLGSYFAVRVARFNREYSLPLLGFLTHALLKKM